MNTILGILRKFSLFGVVTMVLTLAIKKPANNTKIIVILAVLAALYLGLAFVTYLIEKHAAANGSEQPEAGTSLGGYLLTLLKSLALDIFSPVLCVVDLTKEKTTSKIVALIVTYLLIGFYFAMWLFVL